MLESIESIGMRPVDVTPAVAERFLSTVYSTIKIAGPAKYKVGNSVRVSKYKTKRVTHQIEPPRCLRSLKRTNPVTYPVTRGLSRKI